mmetsp:Transcript_50060/g.76123  ORF Transcript_50060/g.76123 Transcript_50060/m.76123 type:complete len:205 (+) Transcript_50060:77-691(+)
MFGIRRPSMITPRFRETPTRWRIAPFLTFVSNVILILIGVHRSTHVVPVVDTHASSIPIRLHTFRLHVKIRIHRLAYDIQFHLFPTTQSILDVVGKRNRLRKLRPRPMTVPTLFDGLVQFSRLPILASVDGHVDTFDFAATSGPGDALDGNVRGGFSANERILWRIADQGLDRHFLDDGGLVETGWRPVRQIFLKVNVGGKAAV